jgi:tight adherence protein C
MNIEYIIYALMVVGVFTIYMALVHLFRPDAKKSRMQRTAADAFYEDQEEKRTPAFASFCAAIVALTGVDVKKQKELASSLSQAGINSPYAAYYYLFFKRIIQPVILVVGVYFFIKGVTSVGLQGSQKAKFMFVGLFFTVIGMFGATLYVNNAKQKRQKKLLRSFPEGLDLLLVCIESGLGLDAALGRVCSELSNAHPELGQELERTRIELTMMSDRAQALQNLAERTQILPFRSLVAALIQTEKFGTSLLETLRVLSEDQRITRLLNAENKAAKIPVLITIPLIFCIMPAFMIIILGPPIIRVIEMGGIMGGAGKQK